MNANSRMKDRTLVAVVAGGGVKQRRRYERRSRHPQTRALSPEPWSSWRRGGRLCPRCGVDHHLCLSGSGMDHQRRRRAARRWWWSVCDRRRRAAARRWWLGVSKIAWPFAPDSLKHSLSAPWSVQRTIRMYNGQTYGDVAARQPHQGIAWGPQPGPNSLALFWTLLVCVPDAVCSEELPSSRYFEAAISF